jgi:Spy/CpxP family protein refolding chaperone
MHIRIILLLGFAMLAPRHAAGQSPALPQVPTGLAASQRDPLLERSSKLAATRAQLEADVAAHRGRCTGVPEDSPRVHECRESQAALNARIAAYKKEEAALKGDIEQAVHSRRQNLEAQVARDIKAIQRLGFARRAEDFVEWERLAGKAKAEFEGEVLDTVTDIAVDKARGGLLEFFKGFDTAKATRLVEWIRARGMKPEPAALISAIERVGRAPDKAGVAEDAEFIVKQIEDFRKGRAAAGDPVESAKFLSGLLEGLISDPRLALLITESRLTVAALYNNAARGPRRSGEADPADRDTAEGSATPAKAAGKARAGTQRT